MPGFKDWLRNFKCHYIGITHVITGHSNDLGPFVEKLWQSPALGRRLRCPKCCGVCFMPPKNTSEPHPQHLSSDSPPLKSPVSSRQQLILVGLTVDLEGK